MDRLLSFGKLISDPTRLKIIKLLLTQPMCVCEVMEVLRLNQPCISQHLTILKYHHLLSAQREGKWIVYKINRKTLKYYLKETEQFLKAPLGKLGSLKKEYRRLSDLKNRGLLCTKSTCK